MKQTIVIAGNHLVSLDGIEFEISALCRGLSLANEDADLILFFDHARTITLPELAIGKVFPLVSLDRFKLKQYLPIETSLPKNTLMIFENSLRNYARSMQKKENTKLTKDMYKTGCDIVSCNCLGIIVSLLEILYYKYSYKEIVWVEQKINGRTKVHDLLNAQIIFPELKVIWI